jgi:hypothetical protein
VNTAGERHPFSTKWRVWVSVATGKLTWLLISDHELAWLASPLFSPSGASSFCQAYLSPFEQFRSEELGPRTNLDLSEAKNFAATQ